jgi:tRNA-2-methylthio-N6-dimethylallyladenosine synthase
VLKAMKRSYRRDRYLAILDRVRRSMPQAAITTDLIVGFPGESDEDFEQTLDLVEQARFAGAYTFIYSKRPGTPAAGMPEEVPASVVKERYAKLLDRVNQIAWEENLKLERAQVEVLVAEGEGRKDGATRRMSGRARDNRLVHFTPGDTAIAPGDLVTVTVTHAAPHHLVSDAPIVAVRQTRASEQRAGCGSGAVEGRAVGLGMPTIGVPADQSTVTC